MNDRRMFNRRFVLALALCFVALAGSGSGVAIGAEEEPYVPPAVKDPDATIQAQMRGRWTTPQRQLWRIAYHPIKGLTAHSAWHIEGTHWRVRVSPGWIKLDEFDKASVYELDAVALDQNYGVIDFYVFLRQQAK